MGWLVEQRMGKKADLIAVQNKFGAFEDTHDLGAKVGLGEGDVVGCQTYDAAQIHEPKR